MYMHLANSFICSGMLYLGDASGVNGKTSRISVYLLLMKCNWSVAKLGRLTRWWCLTLDVSAQTEIKTRIVACGVSLANARDLGVDRSTITCNFQFLAKVNMSTITYLQLLTGCSSARPLDMDIHLQSFTIPHFLSLMIVMSKPAYLAIAEYSPTKPVVIFVPSRQQCRLTVDNLLTHCAADDYPDRFLNIEEADSQPHLDHLTDPGLTETLKHGIGYYHEALSKQDKRIIERLFESGAIQVLVVSKVCVHLTLV
jgi:pre-mRNA-splicing helicase BRR2